MVEIDLQKETLVMDETEANSLREERQRTGRYIAVGTAIFLSLLGLYQAVVRGTPQYAALFAPALIMFIYILWILNASANQRKALLAAAAASSKSDLDSVVEIELDSHNSNTKSQSRNKLNHIKNANNKIKTENKETTDNNIEDKQDQEDLSSRIIYSRSYSIA